MNNQANKFEVAIYVVLRLKSADLKALLQLLLLRLWEESVKVSDWTQISVMMRT